MVIVAFCISPNNLLCRLQERESDKGSFGTFCTEIGRMDDERHSGQFEDSNGMGQ